MKESGVLFFLIISVVVMIVFALSIILFFSFSRRKILDEKLKNQEQEIKHQSKLLQVTIETQEEERERIARDLHDDISSKLNVVNLNLQILRKKVPEDQHEIIDSLQSSLAASIDRSRTMAHELMPPALVKFGLKVAIDGLLSEVFKASGLNVKFIGREWADSFKSESALHVFRIIQEWVNNTLKYAEAQSIYLEFNKTADEKLCLSYRDDGIGIKNIEKSTGMGTLNIISRCQILGAELEMPSTEKGVWYTLTFNNG